MQAKAAKAAPMFLRTSYTEKVVFSPKPDRVTRQALVAAGFHWSEI